MGISATMDRERAAQTRRKAKVEPQPKFVPEIPTPPNCVEVAMGGSVAWHKNNPVHCERCEDQSKWSGIRLLKEVEGIRDAEGNPLHEPIRYIVFHCIDVIFPKFTRIRESGRDAWDVWPVIPDLLKVWLCPECYATVDSMGFARWAEEWRWSHRFGLAEVTRDLGWGQSPTGDAIQELGRRVAAGDPVIEMPLEPEGEEELRAEIEAWKAADELSRQVDLTGRDAPTRGKGVR